MELERIRELIQLMVDNELAEIDIRDGESRISLKRGPGGSVQQVVVPPPMPALSQAHSADEAGSGQSAPPQNDTLTEIVSPMVGTFYAASDPENAPFVTVGTRVEPGSTVCIIEAMKVFNEIKSEVSGTIAKILVQNEEAVEYGQPLFLVDPD